MVIQGNYYFHTLNKSFHNLLASTSTLYDVIKYPSLAFYYTQSAFYLVSDYWTYFLQGL